MKFRVSTQNGDSYGFEAKNLAEAQALAGQWHEGERFTVYEDRSLVSGAYLFGAYGRRSSNEIIRRSIANVKARK